MVRDHLRNLRKAIANEKILYLYDANGTKLQKTYYEDNHLMQTTDYSGMFVYKDDHLDYIQTSEGRLKWDDHDHLFYVEYFIKDHLGNVRDVITTNPNQSNYITQVTDYYPFGLEIQEIGASDNLQLYNSKELQTDAKLWWYDYRAKFYDPVLGRWHSVDPMAETSRRWSPYSYCMNNPIRFIDPDGMGVDEFNVNKQTGEISKISNKGGNKTDYFNIGTSNEQGTFVTEKSLSTQRGTGSVNSFRFKEDTKGTISSFVIPQEGKDITGFFLEPAGPSKSRANINKRIPEGTFSLMKNDGSAYPNDFKLFNGQVSKDRGILMHIGNFNDNTAGCLLPGCGFGIGKIGQKGIETPEEIGQRAGFLRTNSSGPKLGEINSFIRQKGPENVKVNIFNIIDDEE